MLLAGAEKAGGAVRCIIMMLRKIIYSNLRGVDFTVAIKMLIGFDLLSITLIPVEVR